MIFRVWYTSAFHLFNRGIVLEGGLGPACYRYPLNCLSLQVKVAAPWIRVTVSLAIFLVNMCRLVTPNRGVIPC